MSRTSSIKLDRAAICREAWNLARAAAAGHKERRTNANSSKLNWPLRKCEVRPVYEAPALKTFLADAMKQAWAEARGAAKWAAADPAIKTRIEELEYAAYGARCSESQSSFEQSFAIQREADALRAQLMGA